jgi:F420-0:gamma-glutamyl ligase-like protein
VITHGLADKPFKEKDQMRYSVRLVRTKYWRVGDDYLKIILDSTISKINSGDILVISEKAISVALGRIVDEEKMEPGFTAWFLTEFWMRIVWGFFLGFVCRMNRRNIERLRNYPKLEGSRHKQLALNQVGFAQALRHGSEGGIDVTNVPRAYACLPLRSPQTIANRISKFFEAQTKKNISVVIVDSDKTYSFHGFHITPRPNPISGIKELGLFAYVIGRLLKWRPRSTPLALSGSKMGPEEALQIAAVANKARGYGAGRTAWDMAESFSVDLTHVTLDMLEKIPHYPIVIIRRLVT